MLHDDFIKKCRLLVVTQYFSPEDFRINAIVERLTNLGASITVLTGLPNYPQGHLHPGYTRSGPWRERIYGADVIRCPIITRGTGPARLLANYLSYAVTASVIGTWRLRRREFDAILVFQISPVTSIAPALLIRKIKHAPVLAWVLDIWPQSLEVAGFSRNSLVYRISGFLASALYRRCDRLLLQSRAYRSVLAATGVPADIMLEFPNFAEDFYSERVAEPAPPPELAGLLKPDFYTIMYAGNIGAAQGVYSVLEAASKLRAQGLPIAWIFLGEGREMPNVQARAIALNLSDCVRFLGRLPQTRMPEFFAYADAMLVSTTATATAALTVPGRIQSFMAAGKPIIGAVEGAARDLLIESGAGVTTEPDNPDALAELVRRFIGMSKAEREAMGRNGREYFCSNFTLDALIRRLSQICRETLEI